MCFKTTFLLLVLSYLYYCLFFSLPVHSCNCFTTFNRMKSYLSLRDCVFWILWQLCPNLKDIYTIVLLLLISKKMEKLKLLGKARFIRLFAVPGIILTVNWNSEGYKIWGEAFIISPLHKPKRGVRFLSL